MAKPIIDWSKLIDRYKELEKENKRLKEVDRICVCGDLKENHFSEEGACDKCACTWYHQRLHPNKSDRIKVAAKELLDAFPDKIPQDCEDLKFNIPAYLVQELEKALREK